MRKREYTIQDYNNDFYYFYHDYQWLQGDHYFDEDTLNFFGEQMSDFKILENKIVVKDFNDKKHTCFVLSKVSQDFTGRYFRNYDYFDVNTLERII